MKTIARRDIGTLGFGLGFGLILALAAMPAAAQEIGGSRVAVAVGVGRVNPLPLSLPYTAPAWSISMQVAAAKHLVFEGTATGWHHTTTSSSNEQIRDRTGTLFIREAAASTRHGKNTIGVNALAAAKLGRLRLTSGAGVAFGFFSSRTTETVTTCTSADTDVCDAFAETFRLRLFSIQCVLGADVPVTSRLQAFVVYRLVQPFSYGLGEINIVTGLKVGLR